MFNFKIVTIHKGDILELVRTINSVLSQSVYPDSYQVITPRLPVYFSQRYKHNKFIEFIIGKDKSLYNAMNIGLKHSNKMNLIYLNSGDTFCHRNCIKQIIENLKVNPNRVFIFKVILKYKDILFFPKFNYFNNTKYLPHPGFIRPPVITEGKNFKFKEKYASISDSFWISENLKKFKVNKINKNLIIHNLGGISTTPNFKLILEKKKLSFLNFVKELIKFVIFKTVTKKLFYKFIYFSKFKIKKIY